MTRINISRITLLDTNKHVLIQILEIIFEIVIYVQQVTISYLYYGEAPIPNISK